MTEYYEFEVKLRDIRPAPTRRFLLHQSATFEDLHDAIQGALMWYGGHMWGFGSTHRELSDVADCEGEEAPLARRVKLSGYFGKKGERAKKVYYTYDFGDCWEHAITLKRVVTQEPATHWRKLLSGANLAPPEDCGGPPGFERLLACLNTGEDPWEEVSGEALQELLEYYGLSSHAFDLEAQRGRFDVELDPVAHRKLLNTSSSGKTSAKTSAKASGKVWVKTSPSPSPRAPTRSAPAAAATRVSDAERFRGRLAAFLPEGYKTSAKKLDTFDHIEAYLREHRVTPPGHDNVGLALTAWMYVLTYDARGGGVLSDRKPQIQAAALIHWLDTRFGARPPISLIASQFGVSGPSVTAAYIDIFAVTRGDTIDHTHELQGFSKEVCEGIPERAGEGLGVGRVSPLDILAPEVAPLSATAGVGDAAGLLRAVMASVERDDSAPPPELFQLIGLLKATTPEGTPLNEQPILMELITILNEKSTMVHATQGRSRTHVRVKSKKGKP